MNMFTRGAGRNYSDAMLTKQGRQEAELDAYRAGCAEEHTRLNIGFFLPDEAEAALIHAAGERAVNELRAKWGWTAEDVA